MSRICRVHARAEGALKLGELHDRDLRVLLTLERAVADRDLVDGLVVLGGPALVGLGGRLLVVLLHERGVDLVGLRPGLGELLGGLELLVDDGLEGVERTRTAQLDTVDAEVGRAARADLLGERHVGVDLGLELVGVQGLLELGHVEAETLSVAVEVRARERLLVLEELVVHLPELALLAGGEGGLRRKGRVLVEGQRVVLEGDADLARVGVEDLLDGRIDPRAEGALELGELDDGDGGVGAGALGGAGADREDVAVSGGDGDGLLVAVLSALGALPEDERERADGDDREDDGLFTHFSLSVMTGRSARQSAHGDR